MKLPEKIRWQIAGLLDRLPGQCWTDLAMYGLGHKRTPWSPMDPMCQTDADRCGVCYCGKLRTSEPAPAEQVTR